MRSLAKRLLVTTRKMHTCNGGLSSRGDFGTVVGLVVHYSFAFLFLKTYRYARTGPK